MRAQSQHPLLWGSEQLSWLRGSPMQRTLSERSAQIEEDTDALMVAGADEAAAAAGLKVCVCVCVCVRGSQCKEERVWGGAERASSMYVCVRGGGSQCKK
eukprot:326338-Chlamydomonas_euryale.AAC.3